MPDHADTVGSPFAGFVGRDLDLGGDLDPGWEPPARCAHCNRGMRPKRSTRRYCSTTCRVAANRGEEYRPPRDAIYCEWDDCEEIIWAPRPGQHFCSAACRARSWRMYGAVEESDAERAGKWADLLEVYAGIRRGAAVARSVPTGTNLASAEVRGVEVSKICRGATNLAPSVVDPFGGDAA